MSKYSHRPKGGIGIEVTTDELIGFADKIGSMAINEYIPLPDVDFETQKKRINKNDPTYDNVIYWETETGEHGWCNDWNGVVVQWG